MRSTATVTRVASVSSRAKRPSVPMTQRCTYTFAFNATQSCLPENGFAPRNLRRTRVASSPVSTWREDEHGSVLTPHQSSVTKLYLASGKCERNPSNERRDDERKVRNGHIYANAVVPPALVDRRPFPFSTCKCAVPRVPKVLNPERNFRYTPKKGRPQIALVRRGRHIQLSSRAGLGNASARSFSRAQRRSP